MRGRLQLHLRQHDLVADADDAAADGDQPAGGVRADVRSGGHASAARGAAAAAVEHPRLGRPRDRPAPGPLGTGDKQRLDEYLQHLREVEGRIQKAEKQSAVNPNAPEAPIGIPETHDDHLKVMFDLMALA